MSVYNNLFLHTGPDGNKLNPEILLMSGPILSVEISIPSALASALTKENKPTPNPTTGWALIDTGATRSCVDDDVIRKLGVNPIGAGDIHNSGGKQSVNFFPAHFRFPGVPLPEIEFTSAIGVNISAQKVNNQPIIALLGRDILRSCVFIYNGTLGMYTLSI